MTTQKTFKARVRARAEKTGESYTAARAQLLRPSADRDRAPTTDVDVRELTGVSDEAIQRATARPLREWLELLDGWGATERRHAEIARWLMDAHAVPGWYAQTISVGYERARGMRAKHQNAAGFSVSATRTIAAPPERASDAFTDASVRVAWLPDAPVRVRTVRPGRSARFDWDDPPSRLIVDLAPKDGGRTVVTIAHERLPDAETAQRMKGMWRERLGILKALLEVP